jgi:hypothetical protein
LRRSSSALAALVRNRRRQRLGCRRTICRARHLRWDACHGPLGHRYGPKLAAGALAKPPRLTSGISGQQLDWRADPASGEPYVIGDAMVGASIVHQASWGDKNKFLGMVGVLSVCTITGFDGLYADMTQVNFSGRNATGYFHDFMYLSTQLGAMPEGAALDMTAPDSSNMPDWSAAIRCRASPRSGC